MKLQGMFSVVVAAAAALLWLGGCAPSKTTCACAGTTPTGTPTANLICPMTGNLVTTGKNAPCRMYGDRCVGFCSWDCPAAWDALPDKDKTDKLAAAIAKQQTMVANNKCPMTGRAINKGVPMRIFNGKIIGFCCGACPSAWDELPQGDKRDKLEAAMK